MKKLISLLLISSFLTGCSNMQYHDFEPTKYYVVSENATQKNSIVTKYYVDGIESYNTDAYTKVKKETTLCLPSDSYEKISKSTNMYFYESKDKLTLYYRYWREDGQSLKRVVDVKRK